MPLTLLDRLIDDNPENQIIGEPVENDIEDLKASLKRDLEFLFNTRECVTTFNKLSPEVHNSLLTYGLPDFTSISINNIHHHQQIRQTILQAINKFEPRLQDILITLNPGNVYERKLKFRVEARLKTRPVPTPIVFDALIEAATKRFSISMES